MDQNGVKKRKLTCTIAAVILLLLSSCVDQPEQTIRIGSSPWSGYEPLFLSRQLGYLDEDSVSLFELPSADITMEAFRNHSIDIAPLPLDGVLELLQDGTKLRIILVMDVSNGGDVALVSPDIKKISDIKGKRVVAVNIPLGLYMVRRLLDKAGLERKDINLQLITETEMVDYYKRGLADVIITYDPVKTALQKVGMKVIFDSTEIPNEIFDVLVVHEDVYQRQTNEVCGIVKTWFKTLHYMEQNPAAAAKKISRRIGVTEADFQTMMSGIVIPDQTRVMEMLGGSSPALLAPANRLVSLLVKEGLLRDKVDVSTAIDAQFISCVK
ncbi:MAG: ABC transporter substrate-binding protein [Gammaproteobacteria bacterium]|nr:ABC transporter substrate-binding protein [Gammaproteobacteria bacterium]